MALHTAPVLSHVLSWIKSSVWPPALLTSSLSTRPCHVLRSHRSRASFLYSVGHVLENLRDRP